MKKSHLAATKKVKTHKEVVDIAVKGADIEIQEEDEETISRDPLMLKIHRLAPIVARVIILRNIVGTSTNQSATIIRHWTISRMITNSRPINKHNFQREAR